VVWYLDARVNLPWKPRIKPYIVRTIYKINKEGLISFQEDKFTIPEWDIVLSAFLPASIQVGSPAVPCPTKEALGMAGEGTGYSGSEKAGGDEDNILARLRNAFPMFAVPSISTSPATDDLVRSWSRELASLLQSSRSLSPQERSRVKQLVQGLSCVPSQFKLT